MQKLIAHVNISSGSKCFLKQVANSGVSCAIVKSLHRYYEAYVFDLSFSGVKEKTLLAQYFHGESGEELVNCIVFVKKEKWYNDN